MKILRAYLIAICLSCASAALASDLTAENINKFALSQKWLGHFFYEANGAGFRSRIDSDAFFYSKKGKTEPKPELVATINELQKIEPISNTSYCRFISRFELVLQEFPQLKKNSHNCDAFEIWFNRLSINEIRLSFATGYLKNPASSFGHLFLKLISNKSKSELLNYGVNFSALTGSESGADFALKGLFGYYSGGFVFLPYHQIIKDYSDLEGRDIWELNLQMTDAQIRQILTFLYEFDANSMTYTFLGNNCAGVLERLIYSVKQTTSKEFSMNKPWKIPYESFQRIAGTLPAINFHFQPALKTVWSIWEAELTQFEKKNIARELKTNNFLNLSVKELDFALLDLKIQNSNVESIDYNLILQHRAKINGITFDSPATSRGTDSPLLSKPKSSLVTANMMAQELEFRLSILADRLIYNQGNSEINLFDFHFKTKDRANIFFSELGVFSFLAGEPVNFIRQPVSYGGGLSYIQEMGLKAEAFVGLLYSENRMRFFPKIRFQILRQTSEFGPEIDVYFLGSTIHLRGTLSPYDSIFEIQKTWNNTYTTSLLAMKNFKASAPEGQINFGRFF